MCNKEKNIVATASEMSNLVGMYAFKLTEDRKIESQFFIKGKASNKYFIVQSISALDGAPNVAKLITLKQLVLCVIVPTKQLADEILDDYYKNHVWRYIPFEL